MTHDLAAEMDGLAVCLWCKRPLQEDWSPIYCSPRCRAEAEAVEPCRYCGMPAQTRDHVLSKRMRAALADAGLTVRRRLPNTVPCCRECNSLAGARMFLTLGAKRRYLQQRLRERYAHVLRAPDWSPDELDELGYTLRTFVERREQMKRIVRARVSWPRTRQKVVA